MLTERTEYWAKDGCYEEVLATQRRANRVRLSLGLDAETIRIKSDP